MRLAIAILAASIGAAFATTTPAVAAQAAAGHEFTIYVVDTEGGQSVIYISPTGDTLVMDSGNPGGRDTDRIMQALHDAGVTEVDYLVSTHYDIDHIGGLKELAARIPIHHYVDHGPSVATTEQYPGFLALYASIYAKADHQVAKVGEKLPVKGLDVLVVTAANQVLKSPLKGGGKPNAACAGFTRHDEADDENAQSVGLLFTYGKFRTINLGDFTWNSEFNLMCPTNPIGGVDVYLTSHHGLNRSGSPALVHGLQPLVAIMHNGPRKGATPQTLNTLHASPGLVDVWQLHWGESAGLEYNSPGQFIANMDDPAVAADAILHPPQARAAGTPAPPFPGYDAFVSATGHTPAYWIKVVALTDGTFTVSNPRNGFSKTYRGGHWQSAP
jgi:beta-lactamase superfamily II metal-dependent hydrolase